MTPFETIHPNGQHLSSIYVTPCKFIIWLQSDLGIGKTCVATENLTLALDFTELKTKQP